MYTEQIQAGQNYSVFKKCINISILDFILFEKEQEFHSCFHIKEDTHNILFTDKMEFHILELPKIPEQWKDSNDDLLLWAKFISSEQKEDFEVLAEKNIYLDSAYQQLQVISQDKEKRLEYEARQKAILDYNQAMLEAEQRGEKRGYETGGQERNLQIARNMLKKGGDKNTIMELTGLDIREIEELH